MKWPHQPQSCGGDWIDIYQQISYQDFQYFSSLPVLHYLQVVLFIKIGTIFMNILYNSLKSGDTKGR
jgi:hypothetical protein